MGSVQKKRVKDGSYRYHAVYKLPNGRWKWESGGRIKKNAEALLRRREREIAEGTYNRTPDITFKELRPKWLNHKKLTVRERTYRDYEQITRNHLGPEYDDTLLRDITPAFVEDYLVKKSGGKLQPRTINKTLTVLKMMMKSAEQWGYIEKNPARFARRIRECHREMEFLSPGEIRRFLAELSRDFYVLFLTVIMTGLRQGELFGLRWMDFDPVRRLLFVRRTYHPDYGFMETKTASSRRAVSLSPALTEALVQYKKEMDGNADDLVFRNSAGGPLNGQNLVTRVFYPALEAAGVKRVRFHDLRHTYAALMISMGANIKLIQRQMGHASIQTTLDRYGHLLPDVTDGVGERLDEIVLGSDSH